MDYVFAMHLSLPARGQLDQAGAFLCRSGGFSPSAGTSVRVLYQKKILNQAFLPLCGLIRFFGLPLASDKERLCSGGGFAPRSHLRYAFRRRRGLDGAAVLFGDRFFLREPLKIPRTWNRRKLFGNLFPSLVTKFLRRGFTMRAKFCLD